VNAAGIGRGCHKTEMSSSRVDFDLVHVPGKGGAVVKLGATVDGLRFSNRRLRILVEVDEGMSLEEEELRAEPRDAGVVLLEAFGGFRLRAAFEAHGPPGLMVAIDAALAATPS
jgi:hypothetical protein